MKKGIIKLSVILASALLIIMPFSYSIYADETIVDWDTFGVDINQAGAYSYWFKNGLSNIVYQEQQTTGYVITTTYGQHNYNLSYQGILTGTYTDMNVYNYNGSKLGKYHSAYHVANTAGNLDYINYIASDNTLKQCSRCYVGFETADDYITRITETEYQSQESGNNTYVNRFQQVIPSLKGTYSHPTTYNNRYKGIAYPNGTYTISFMSNLQLNYITPSITLISDRDISALTVTQVEQTNLSNWDLRTFEIKNNSNVQLPFDFYIPQFNNKSVEIIPVYQGEKNAMTPELYALAYNDKYIYETHDTELIEIMSNGNSGSQSAVDNADYINNDFQNANTTFDDLESDFSSDMNTSLNAIDTNLNVNNLSGFVYGANWVKTQFDFMINNYEPVELLVTYSLILGLAMLLLGKRLL